MQQNFKNVKSKAEELNLSPDQIKAAFKLFQYAELYRVEFYLKPGDKLGMKEKPKKVTDIIDELFNFKK